MKIPIVADTHFGINNNNEFLNTKIGEFFVTEFFPYMLEHNMSTFVFAGDLVDKRQGINTLIADMIMKYYVKPIKENDFEVYQVIGNHDCYYRSTNAINTPKILLESLDKDQYEIIDDWFHVVSLNMEFVGWGKPHKNHQRFLICHYPFKGFEYQNGIVNKTGVDPQHMHKYEKVISGHFHKRDTKGNITYVGSPIEMNFGEAHYQHGFYVLDTETGDLEFIPTKIKIFEKLAYEDDGDFKKIIGDKDLKGKIVKVTAFGVKDEKRFQEFKDLLLDTPVHELKVATVETSVKNILEGDIIEGVEDIFKVMKMWIEKFCQEEDVDEKLFTSLALKVYNEIMEV